MKNKEQARSRINILITGGSGMIGRYLTSMLLEAGYTVSHLSRGQPGFGRVRVFRWDPDLNILDPQALINVDHIIHLAGANLGEKRWTPERKKEIIDSRVNSAALLYKTMKDGGFKPGTFISASGVNYYGTLTSEKIFFEKDHASDDFAAIVCQKWENAADLFNNDGIRTVKIRTALVLEKNNLALTRMTMPAKFGFLAVTGSGKQYMPWIHIKDLCRIYIKAIEDDSFDGAYNAVAEEQVSQADFMKNLSDVLKLRVFPLNVPGTILTMLYGQMADLVLKGSRVSSAKIRDSGFVFEFDKLGKALKETYS